MDVSDPRPSPGSLKPQILKSTKQGDASGPSEERRGTPFISTVRHPGRPVISGMESENDL